MSNSKAKLIIRNATPDDIPGLQGLSARVYGEGEEYSRDHLMAQINRFRMGSSSLNTKARLLAIAPPS